MHQLTAQRYSVYSLWIKLVDEHRVPHIYPYNQFKVHDEDSHYRLSVNTYQGRLFDYFTGSDGKPFITQDRDKDQTDPEAYYSRNRMYSAMCAGSTSYTGGGGWWFEHYSYSTTSSPTCGATNLNARKPYYSSTTTIASVEMKIRPVE